MKHKLALVNGRIFTEYEIYEQHALLIESDLIAGIVPEADVPEGFELMDVKGANISPGLIDLQIYGTGEDLFSAELTVDSIYRIEQNLLKQGCTSFVLTLATNTLELFNQAIQVFEEAKPKVALGLHLEGPFLNAAKRGAHPAELIQKASLELLGSVVEGKEDVVKMMTLAPELTEQECIDYLNEKVVDEVTNNPKFGWRSLNEWSTWATSYVTPYVNQALEEQAENIDKFLENDIEELRNLKDN